MIKTIFKKHCRFFLFLFFLSHPAMVLSQTSRTLTIVPPTQEFKTQSGKQIAANVKIRNETDEAVTLKVGIKDFLVLDDQGTPTMVEEETSGRWSLSSWIIVSPTEFTLPARSSKVFDLAILVPEDALPGGHYASVYFTPQEDSLSVNQSGSVVETRLSSLIKLIVEGPIREAAYIRKFQAPSFSEYGPIEILTQIENQSDLHITPKGSLVIKNILGKTLANLPLDEKRIFPYAIRSFSNTFDRRWLLGRYQAFLSVTYGQSGQVLEAHLFFWVIPWKIITAIILTLTLLILIYYWWKEKRTETKMGVKSPVG